MVVTAHLYDGKKSLPLDIELYQHASSLPQGKKDLEFKKKNASTFAQASDIDYFITNVDSSIATDEWIVTTYAQRIVVEVFYREAKGWLGLKEYQVRNSRSLLRHFILVFCAYTFILWHTLTGGLRRRWASKPLNTFTDSAAGARTRATALEAFRTAMSFRASGVVKPK